MMAGFLDETLYSSCALAAEAYSLLYFSTKFPGLFAFMGHKFTSYRDCLGIGKFFNLANS